MNSHSGNKKKSAMVVGAGFAGIRSALDLAEAGLKVYLVDKEYMPGGMLSGLVKMFPSDDCAACTALPGDLATGCQRQYPDVLNHPNIEFIGGAHVEGLEGNPGNFTASLRLSPGYITNEQCIGCGDCIDVCPVLLDPLSGKRAVHSLFPQASSFLKIEKGGQEASCSQVCPLGVNVPAFLQLVKEKRFLEAWNIICDTNPFPGMCSYWCHQPCSAVCKGRDDESVDIPGLIRFVTKYVYANNLVAKTIPLPAREKQNIAIIGSSPIGLSAARELTKNGYQVTVMESSAVPGGSLRSMLSPELGEMFDKEIEILEDSGVKIITRAFTEQEISVEKVMSMGYSAVLLDAVEKRVLASPQWLRVSNGERVLTSYQVSLYPEENLPVLLEEPMVLQNEIPGVFTVRNMNPGILPLGLAIGAGIRAARNIEAFLTMKHPSRKSVQSQCPLTAIYKESETTGYNYLADREKTSREYDLDGALAEAGKCINCTGGCVECNLCVKACPTGAIDLQATGRLLDIQTSALLLSPGCESFDPGSLEYYGYGKFPNVVTSLEFEKILEQATVKGTSPQRPAGTDAPDKIAWIQCVGSRDLKNNSHCSSICCQYALKEAVMAKTRFEPAPDIVIFGMDIRPYDSGGEEYWRRAVENYHIRFERTRIYSLEETPDQNLRVRYSREDGSIAEEIFNLVVLSVGLQPSAESSVLYPLLDLKPDASGFCHSYELTPGFTNKPGIMAAGTFTGPKDISTAVTEARAAATAIIETLGLKIDNMPSPDTGNLNNENGIERVGVFICTCGDKITAAVDTEKLLKEAKGDKRVVHARILNRACLPYGLNELALNIKEHKINRVLLAGCTPRTHAARFKKVLYEAGIHPNYLEHINIREQVAWSHRGQYNQATEKAVALLRAGVTKLRNMSADKPGSFAPNRSVLVIGGGPAGLTSALALAGRGIEVALVDKLWDLEGGSKKQLYTLNGAQLKKHTSELAVKAIEHAGVKIYNGSQVSSVSGGPGNFISTLETPSGKKYIRHGAVIIAAGANPATTNEYLYGLHDAVINQVKLEQMLVEDNIKALDTVVMIQCAGSRQEGQPYCSRSCCPEALKNALKLKNARPDSRIYILYRDITVFGTDEDYYQEARRQGILFIRYEPDHKPLLTPRDNKITVTVKELILQQDLTIEADTVVLSTGIVPMPENKELSQLYGISLDENGFYARRQAKMRPVDASIPGVYLCGPALGPGGPREEFTQARAAAMGAIAFLARAEVPVSSHVSLVNSKWCRGCGLCVSACPVGARRVHPVLHVAQVDKSLCLGCGACQAACPGAATTQFNLSKKQILDVIEDLIM